jgi:DNA-binding GntR family transcriptional regulator
MTSHPEPSIDTPPLDRQGLLAESVYQRLRRDILDGGLQPGQILRQEELARRCNVSRVPLREAMARLTADGLLLLRPRRGYAVISLDASEIVEVFELRAVTEAHAGYIAARSRRPEDVAEAARLVDAMRDLDPGNPDAASQWSRLNYDFHACMIGATRRRRLVQITSALRDAVEPYIRVELRLTGDAEEAERDHRELLAAFRAGDARGLSELCRLHVERTAERLLRQLRHRDLAAPDTNPIAMPKKPASLEPELSKRRYA